MLRRVLPGTCYTCLALGQKARLEKAITSPPTLLYHPGSSHTCLSHFTQALSGSQLMEWDFRKNPAILSNMVDVMADGSLYLSNEKKIGIS